MNEDDLKLMVKHQLDAIHLIWQTQEHVGSKIGMTHRWLFPDEVVDAFVSIAFDGRKKLQNIDSEYDIDLGFTLLRGRREIGTLICTLLHTAKYLIYEQVNPPVELVDLAEKIVVAQDLMASFLATI